MLKRFDPFPESLQHDWRLRQGSYANISECLQALLEEVRRKPHYLDRLVMKASGRIIFVAVCDVDWFDAAGNYVRVHVGKAEYLIRETMNGLEAKLDPSRFLRIHRETIVNVEKVLELQPLFHGNFAVLLKNGAQLTLSRGYRARVQKQLDSNF
jgi:two-component system, LytTR family, response regulator